MEDVDGAVAIGVGDMEDAVTVDVDGDVACSNGASVSRLLSGVFEEWNELPRRQRLSSQS